MFDDALSPMEMDAFVPPGFLYRERTMAALDVYIGICAAIPFSPFFLLSFGNNGT